MTPKTLPTTSALALLLLVTSLNAACPSSAPSSPGKPPKEVAVSATQEALFAGLEDALEESDDQDSYRLQLRYNPTRCESPPYEVFARGRWQRAYLNLDQDALAPLIEALKTPAAQQDILEVNAKQSAPQRSERGVRWPTFVILSTTSPNTATQNTAPSDHAVATLNLNASARCEDR